MRQVDWLLHDCVIWWAAWLRSTVAIYTNHLTNYAAAALTLKSIVDPKTQSAQYPVAITY